MKNEINRTLLVKKSYLKKCTLLGVLTLIVSSVWAVDPTLSINETSQGSSTYLTTYSAEGITISSTASFSSGAVQLGNTPNAYDQHYIEVLAENNEIDSISYKISGNGSNKSIQAPVFGWATTANSNTADTYRILDAVNVTANSYAAAQWFTYDFSESNVKCLRIYRSSKNISSANPSYTGGSTALGSGNTIKVYGFKIWLKPSGPVSVTGVTLNKTTTSIEAGQMEQLTATVQPSNADNKAVSWSTSNPEIATVDQEGNVSAVAPGNTTITVTTADGNKTATCNVTVTAPPMPIPVTAIALNKSTTTIAIGDSETLTIIYTPADANTGKAVTWTSSNTSVATVDNSGKVTGVAAGTATITATSTTDASITASCAVTVQAVAVTGVSINPTSANLQIGGSTDLTYTILPANATDKSVSWSSSNTSVATVNNGHVSAVAAGTATITVTTTDGNKTATCSVTVTAGPPVPSTSLTTHVPEIYEAKEIAGGYNTPLTVVAGREYEVFYINRDNSSNLTVATSNADKAGNICDDSGTSNTAKTKDGWLTIKCNGTGGDTNAGAKDEFQSSIRSAKLTGTSHVMEMHIQGYDQFSFYGNDNNQDASKNKMFEVYIDDVKQTRTPKAYSINRFDITSGEHVIRITGSSGNGDNKLCSFSLRVAQEPRVKREKGNDSAQVVLATTAIQPIVYSTKYNNISGAETRLTWIGAQPAGIDTTMRLGELKDTIIIGGIANCEAGEYNYEIAAYYNDVKKNSLTGKFFVKTDIKSITSTNATVYQNEEMDQIEFKYYALSAENVILTWTGGTTPVGINGNGNNGTYLIGGTPTQTGEYTYSITVQGADTTITGKIIVRELDYGTNPVLYLYKNENAYESDGVRNYLKDNGWNPIERKAKRDGLRPDDQYAVYKLVVISEDVDANNPEVQQIIKENGAKQPVLNLKGFTYAKGEGLLGWGDPSNGAIDSTKNSKEKGTKIKIMHADHPIFKNISNAKEGGEISILSNYALQGIMPIAIDMQYLTDQTLCMGTAPIRKNTLNGYYEEGEWVAAIHEILPSARGGKKYICLPLARNVTLTTTGERLIKGIVDYLVSPTPTTITAPNLLITGFSVKDDKNNEYAAAIDQAEHTITLKLTPEEYQALDSLKEAKPIITHPDYTSVNPASGEEVKLTYAYLRPQKYIITDFINKNVYDFILELYNPQQGIEEVYEAGQWVNIFDIYGRKVATTNEDIYTMELPHGMYIIVTESGETMKIMK